MFDTQAIPRALTIAQLTSEQATAITDAVGKPLGEQVTPGMLRVEIGALRADFTSRLSSIKSRSPATISSTMRNP